ncbi:SDR family oxidoreductase [Vibrio parahaemolyticus]|nr:SDR family oxidoreductase [Vibrio parahaemolyticus]
MVKAMIIKDYVKRLVKYIIWGTPTLNVTADLKVLSIDNSLVGKKVLITGANRGLGLSIAKRCIDSGAGVVISARNEKGLKQAKEVFGDACDYVILDLSIDSNFNHFWEHKALKGVNTLVLNAGVSLHEASFLSVNQSGWDEQFNVNLKANYFLAQSFIRFRNEESLSKVIFLSSERGLIPDDTPYGLTKAAMNSLVKGLSNSFVDKGFLINAIAPGVTASDMTGYTKTGNLAREQSYGKRVFLPEEISNIAWFLISDLSNSISGEVIACDHGSYLKQK